MVNESDKPLNIKESLSKNPTKLKKKNVKCEDMLKICFQIIKMGCEWSVRQL